MGIDAEYEVNYIPENDGRLSLVQIAASDRVFLIHINKLSGPPVFEPFFQLVAKNSIIKLGLDFKGDFRKIGKHFGKTDLTLRDYIEISDLLMELTGQNCESLAKIAQAVLGKELSKYEQCSCWSAYPLRKAQAHYAALDALVLVRIYEQLHKTHAFDAVLMTDNDRLVIHHKMN